MKHRDLVESYLAKTDPTTSEQTFVSLYCWRKGRPLRILEIDNALLLLLEHEEYTTIFGSPIGQIDVQEKISAVKKYIGKNIVAFERVPASASSIIADKGIDVQEDRPNADYVYLKDDLLNLSGNKYHAKKNLITQCVDNYICKYEEISKINMAEVRDFYEGWCKKRACGKTPGICHEYLAITDIMENHSNFDLLGGALRINGNIEAFTIGERLNYDTAVVHFEKANAEIKGSYQLINNWFVKNHLNDFQFINREQDLGIEGLRKAKESYHPDHLQMKHTIYLDDTRPPIKTFEELKCRGDNEF